MGFFKNTDSVPDPYANPINKKQFFLVAGLIGGVLIAVILLVGALLGGGSKNDYVSLVAKVQALQTVADDSQKKIRDRNLAKINSDFTLLLSTDGNALIGQLQKKFGEKQLSADAKKQAIDPALDQKLTEAALLNKFDFTYQNLMRQKINEMLVSAQKIKTDTGGQEFTEVMDTFINNLKTVNKQLEDLTLVASN